MLRLPTRFARSWTPRSRGRQVSSPTAAPAITSNPSNQTVTEPDGATFSVSATGAEPLFYQWQRNSVNISGATSSSYTLTPTSTGDSTAQFRCVVTNAYGSATSNAATLTVNSGTPSTITIPDIYFQVGVAGSVSIRQYIPSEFDGMSLMLVGTLPSGVTFDDTLDEEELVYDGLGVAGNVTGLQVFVIPE